MYPLEESFGGGGDDSFEAYSWSSVSGVLVVFLRVRKAGRRSNFSWNELAYIAESENARSNDAPVGTNVTLRNTSRESSGSGSGSFLCDGGGTGEKSNVSY